MTSIQIVFLALLGLVLLGGLVALGVGHRGWNWGTVAAAFLVLLSATGYFYLAARLGERERLWKERVNRYQVDLFRVRDALVPGPEPERNLTTMAGDGPEARPLADLEIERDRRSRGLDRVRTWSGRSWEGATFQPPQDDAGTGTVELAAEQNAEGNPPLAVGAHVFLFDVQTIEDGGRYVGEFVIRETSFDKDSKRHVLKVAQTAPRDRYDATVLDRVHDDVVVLETLPVDRWLAFYRTRDLPGTESAPLPSTVKSPADDVAAALGQPGDVQGLVRDFVNTFEAHDEPVPEAEWERRIEDLRSGAAQPGTLWAVVEFTKDHRFGDVVEDEPAGGPQREFDAGERAEFDLETALDLRDTEQVADIVGMVYRRPLADALTLLAGAGAGDDARPDDIRSDGLATLMRLLREDIAELERSNDRVEATRTAADDSAGAARKVAAELTKDLETWRRDFEEAGRLAAAFEDRLARTVSARDAAERDVVRLGRELTAAVTRLTGEIDRRAPPPPGDRAR